VLPEQRSAIAREAVLARWMKAGRLKDFVEEKSVKPDAAPETSAELPHSMFQGKLPPFVAGPFCLREERLRFDTLDSMPERPCAPSALR
jgi:hypothetical protein